MSSELLDSLLENELFFVEEIYRLCFLPSQVEFIGDNTEHGWILMLAETESADWNLARCHGSLDKAKGLLKRLPEKDWELLIDSKNLNSGLNDYGYFRKSSLLCLQSNPGKIPELKNLSALMAEYEIRKKINKQSCKLFNAQMPVVYVLRNQTVIAFSKAVRESPAFVEVCIEVAASYRNKGVGTWLLAQMIDFTHGFGKKIVYIVDRNNLASQAIAAKNRLLPFNVICRYSKK